VFKIANNNTTIQSSTKHVYNLNYGLLVCTLRCMLQLLDNRLVLLER